MTILLEHLLQMCDEILQPNEFDDYCPNGLQVEGRQELLSIVSGVTASQALIDRAVELEADVLLVHHGFFWKGEDPCVRGMKKRRLRKLLDHEISLLAYHLPLDAHPVYGNNVQLAQELGIVIEESTGPGNLLFQGYLQAESSGEDFACHISQVLGRDPLWIDAGKNSIKRLAWCTGAAQGYIEQAIELGVDAFISGEISEQTVHVARENNIHYFAAGHHATERYGVQALGQELASRLGLRHQFVDCDNPV